MKTPPVVSPEEWKAAREQMLVKEKEVTRARDALAAERRRMPWMTVEKDYAFEAPTARRASSTCSRDAVSSSSTASSTTRTWPAGRTRLRGCSFLADQVAHLSHLNARDTTLAYVSRAPQDKIQGLEGADGLAAIPWYGITDDFDSDFGVGEWHGTNAFIRDGDTVFRTYFIDSRGDEAHGQHLALPRHHRARPPGGVGGLTGGLPADAALPVVELPRRVW